ncbi:MAG: MFS transporter [Chloroflexota bacterium]|nr:MAG: MFS transporter [Chloroflexota bacterium]
MLRGVTRNVFVLGLVSFLNDISSEMLYPLVPIFLTAMLGAPAVAIGLIEGVAEATASLLRVVSGWYADRLRRRRPLIVGGYAVSAFSKPAIGLAASWPAVLALRFADRFGKAMRNPARDALIADSTPTAYRGRAFGFHRSLDSAGAIVGPLAALALLPAFQEDLRPIFLFAFIPAVASVALLFLVRERQRAVPTRAPFPTLTLKGFGRPFKAVLLVVALFSLGNSSDAFLILRAQDLFARDLESGAIAAGPLAIFGSNVLGLSTAMAVLAYVLYNIVYTLGATPAGMLSDRLGRRGIVIVGFAIYAVVYAGFALVTGSAAIWVLFIVYGFYIAMTEGVLRAYITDLSPTQARATGLGVYYTAVGLASFAASVLGGALWTYVSPVATFAFGGVMAVVAAVVLLVAVPRVNGSRPR